MSHLFTQTVTGDDVVKLYILKVVQDLFLAQPKGEDCISKGYDRFSTLQVQMQCQFQGLTVPI